MAHPSRTIIPALAGEAPGAGVSGEAKLAGGPRLRPRDAATLVLVDRSGAEPRVLMGRRRATQVFLPNKFVFPGGRVDRADRLLRAADDLGETEANLLLAGMTGRPSRARVRALALAAIRETFEETGFVIGDPLAPDGVAGAARSAAPEAWRPFLATGHRPALSALAYFARAITPPSRPRRYDTRFFLADARAIAAEAPPTDDELRDIGWFTLAEMRALDLPNITRAIVEDLAAYLAAPSAERKVPNYSFRHGSFRRDLIALT